MMPSVRVWWQMMLRLVFCLKFSAYLFPTMFDIINGLFMLLSEWCEAAHSVFKLYVWRSDGSYLIVIWNSTCPSPTLWWFNITTSDSVLSFRFWTCALGFIKSALLYQEIRMSRKEFFNSFFFPNAFIKW